MHWACATAPRAKNIWKYAPWFFFSSPLTDTRWLVFVTPDTDGLGKRFIMNASSVQGLLEFMTYVTSVKTGASESLKKKKNEMTWTPSNGRAADRTQLTHVSKTGFRTPFEVLLANQEYFYCSFLLSRHLMDLSWNVPPLVALIN